MQLAKVVSVFIIVALFFALIFANKNINIAMTNSTDMDSISVSLKINNDEPIETKIGNSMLPMYDSNFAVKIGIQNLHVTCDELGIKKQIRVFTIFKTNMHFEFTTDLNNEYVILVTSSWFKLWYE
jgi:hypothetical protein